MSLFDVLSPHKDIRMSLLQPTTSFQYPTHHFLYYYRGYSFLGRRYYYLLSYIMSTTPLSAEQGRQRYSLYSQWSYIPHCFWRYRHGGWSRNTSHPSTTSLEDAVVSPWEVWPALYLRSWNIVRDHLRHFPRCNGNLIYQQCNDRCSPSHHSSHHHRHHRGILHRHIYPCLFLSWTGHRGFSRFRAALQCISA